MPKDLGIDWKLVEADYLRGTRPSEIIRLYGLNPQTLKSRMNRGGWVAKRLALIEATQAKAHQRSVQTLANRASGYLERVVKQVDRGLEVLEAQPPSDVKEVDAHFDALGKIDKIARPALGLNDQGNGTNKGIVNIAVLQQVAEPAVVKICQDSGSDRETHWVMPPESAPKLPSGQVPGECKTLHLAGEAALPEAARLDADAEDSPPAP